MKKKLIEQMKDPRITKGMEGVVAIARIPAAGLLTIDFVDTDTKEVECRHCVTKNEFANYYPDTGIWDNKRLNNANEYERNYMFAKVYGASNIKKAGIGIKGDSLTSIDWHEYMVTQDKRSKSEHRKAVQCNERNEKVPELTEEEMQFLTRYIDGHRIIYYKRRGKYVDIACAECGHHGRYIMSRFMNCFEDVARPYLDFVPEHNMGGEQCPKCGTYAIWKAAGRMRVTQTKEDHRSLISVVDGNMVVRSFLLQKDIFGDEKAASFRTYYTEQSRVWFLDDRVQKDYFKYSGYTGREYWDYCNLAGNRNIQIKVGKTYRGNLDCLKETKFKYSQLDVELARNDYLNVIDYLECYLRYPMIEMLEKLGMTRLKKYLIKNFRWTELIRNGDNLVKRPEYLLKVTKQRFNDLRRKNGSVELLKLYQMEQKKKQTEPGSASQKNRRILF